jgi:HSP20 family molecular chaperone IbpA
VSREIDRYHNKDYPPLHQLVRRLFYPPRLLAEELASGLPVTHGLKIYKQNENLTIEASVKEIPLENLTVTCDKDGVIRIAGHDEKEEEKKEGEKIVYRRKSSSRLGYAVRPPMSIDLEQAEAIIDVDKHVLTITAPTISQGKKEKPRSIPIKIADKQQS